ncbi:MAG TPA: hypothetical protein VGB30_03700 [bacterium]|jgi:hypothetical protein
MIVLWIGIGVVIVAIVWAIIASTSGKPVKSTTVSDPYIAPPEDVKAKTWNVEKPGVHDWRETRTASVSKNFGRGGAPTGIARDKGNIAVKTIEEEDETLAMLKKATPFEPRAMINTETD